MPDEPLGNTFFEFHETVPASTTEDDPQDTEVELTLGIIHQVELIPWGYAVDILHTRIERFHSPIFPVGLGGYISFAAEKISGKVHYYIDKRPATLHILSWNDSTLYPHSFTIRLWMLPEELLLPTPGIWREFKEWFAQIIRPRG